MDASTCFRVPTVLLPGPRIDLAKWAVIACDQYTSEPSYWNEVRRIVGSAPSSLHLIVPEIDLELPDTTEQIALVQHAMRTYLTDGLLYEHAGAIFVERTIRDRIRRGLMLELDLEQYDFTRQSTTPIRPTEGTMIERLAPRIQVRRGAELEIPHVLVLIDDPECTVIEPIGVESRMLEMLYDTDLMLGGGHVTGYALDDARTARVARALCALADSDGFARRHDVPSETPVILFAVGDGNHSLAAAKSYWDSVKKSLGPDHPSRFALVEIENIHDPALEFSPIHRLLLGVRTDIRRALAEEFGTGLRCTDVASASAMRECVRSSSMQAAGLIESDARFSVIEIANAPEVLAVKTLQRFLDHFIEVGGATRIDYVHGDAALERLTMEKGSIGIQFPSLTKKDLFRTVMHEGPLPRKAFSMGEANEKRFYIEARSIREQPTKQNIGS